MEQCISCFYSSRLARREPLLACLLSAPCATAIQLLWLPSKVCVLALLHLSELLGRCGFGEHMPRRGDIRPCGREDPAVLQRLAHGGCSLMAVGSILHWNHQPGRCPPGLLSRPE